MDEFIGTVKAFAFNFSPRGWQFCNGQLLSISQYSTLFALIGTTFGGNGQTTFGLPDLRGRSVVHPGQGPGLSNIAYGQIAGTENVTLTQGNLPLHAHALVPGTGAGQVNFSTVINALSGGTVTNITDNGSNSFSSGGSTANMYSEPGGTATPIGGITTTLSGTTAPAGASQAFSIRNPYVGIYMSICMEGVFPSRN
ncbi:tail fiber protein [Flavobacterium sp. MC2016-06]|jgi:microcystin-dependent protein|uniref:phage tail protein n=1 Tax=Flavobacterium sp. MC2016-06 TaxID=2676308 RepID=UPI0012BAA42B|nr:tail fiber protein [Flavobacterium sp. MC2016-06]MBU3862214.1 tail fiber protein [Flavobacterium sp. MC2016-06]